MIHPVHVPEPAYLVAYLQARGRSRAAVYYAVYACEGRFLGFVGAVREGGGGGGGGLGLGLGLEGGVVRVQAGFYAGHEGFVVVF